MVQVQRSRIPEPDQYSAARLCRDSQHLESSLCLWICSKRRARLLSPKIISSLGKHDRILFSFLCDRSLNLNFNRSKLFINRRIGRLKSDCIASTEATNNHRELFIDLVLVGIQNLAAGLLYKFINSFDLSQGQEVKNFSQSRAHDQSVNDCSAIKKFLKNLFLLV